MGNRGNTENKEKGDLICCLGEILLSVPVEILFQLKQRMKKEEKPEMKE